MADWFSRNEDGSWCNFCGNHLMAPHQLDDENDEAERGKNETFFDDANCDQCGAPDEFTPDAI